MIETFVFERANLIYRTITAISIYPHIVNDFFKLTNSDPYKASHAQNENKPWLFANK